MNSVEHKDILYAPAVQDSIKSSGNALLRVDGLCKAFGGQVVLDNISLELRRGEVVLLHGNNGSGKTTLLNILTGNLKPDAGTIKLFTNSVERTFHFPSHWWKTLNPFELFTPERVSREGVGRTWQEIRLFSNQNLRDNIALATPSQIGENPVWALLRRSAVRKQERKIRSASENILAELGLKGRETSSADKVSLGQSKRVAIAQAIQAGARILFLDEPLAGLDAHGISEVMHLLETLAYDEKVTLVIVEHIFNIPRVLDLASTVWTLENGRLIIDAPDKVRMKIRQTVGDSIQHRLSELSEPNDKIVHRELPGGAVLSTITPSGTHPDNVVLEVKNLVVYRGKRLVIGERKADGQICGLTFSLYKGQLVALQAPNGWGKTTLLEAIIGLLPITQGTIRLNGKPIEDLPPWERVRLGVSFLQSRNHSFPNLAVREALRLAHVTDVPKNIMHLLGRRMSNLSGGEKQQVAMVCMLGTPRIVQLLDEPFSALDFTGVKNLWEIIKREGQFTSLIAIPSNMKGEK